MSADDHAPPSPCRLSVIIPVFNEEESLPLLADELAASLADVGVAHEVIFVDDGSSDGSFAAISALAARHPGFVGIRLGRNTGQTAALAAGIREARGDVIACLDADRQNDPRDIKVLLDKMGEGYDVVSGWRKDRQDPWLTRILPSTLANGLISRITGVHLHDYGCTLKVYRSAYLKPLRLYGEMHRFIPALAGFLGARIAEAPVRHRPRTEGRSNYGLSRTFKVVLDLLTVKFMDVYLAKPIYLIGGWGLGIFLLGGLLSCVTLYKKFFLGIFVKDQPLFQVSIFLALIGFQMIVLGLLAEILVRVYFDIKDKPGYFVKDVIGRTPAPKTH
ncbi:MAG: glycosyltransferase family 2 protein [Elusimicrobia bacterium]|nr:glycosyltransferase family 2 protein [Elusimicrobiota bacterium]